MKPYTKTYMRFFGYTIADWIQCEIPDCGGKAVDIHHIWARSIVSELFDSIPNLMGLCRSCHSKYGDKKQHREFLQDIHDKKMAEVNKK